jgi:hypothetical protein
MSYEDIEEAQAKHAVKEVIKDKRKHGQKHKSAVLEVDDPEPEPEQEREPEVTHAAEEVINGRGKRGQKCKSAALEADKPEPEPEVAQMIEAPEPWRAPVAQMI